MSAAPPGSFLLYGATGYTGRLTAQLARETGLRPILGGRSAAPLARLAAAHGFAHRTVDLRETARLEAALEDVAAVVHMAGPFAHTCAPMLKACLRTGTHYIDITGEYPVLEYCARQDEAARASGIMVMPGAGFDVVPSDCLAKYVAERLPSALHLTLGFAGMAQVSRGTAKTALAYIGRGAAVRRGGRIVRRRRAHQVEMDFGDGAKQMIAMSWGDVATAYHSTGIPDIDVFFEATPPLRRALTVPPPIGRLMRTRPFQALLRALIDRGPAGPDARQRATGSGLVVAEAMDGQRRCVAARLRTPEPYSLTAHTALAILRRVLDGDFAPGFRTPSQAYGADFILEFEGVERKDLSCPFAAHAPYPPSESAPLPGRERAS